MDLVVFINMVNYVYSMFIFGHIGITLGIVFIVSHLVPRIRNKVNYWFVAFGAILPDLIDKTTGRVIFADSVANGRIFAHTLFFVFILVLLTLCLYKYRHEYTLFSGCVAGAAFLHLLEDRMWNMPQTLFWPLLGWDFPKGVNCDNWFTLFFFMFKNSYVPDISYAFVSEVMGLAIVLLFVCGAILQRKYK